MPTSGTVVLASTPYSNIGCAIIQPQTTSAQKEADKALASLDAGGNGVRFCRPCDLAFGVLGVGSRQ